jgi:diguanylate cyclase (GGDEF)-like protein
MPTTDEKTGLLSSHYFRHVLRNDLIPSSDDSGEPLTAFFLDIDKFTSINDHFGFETGDRVILDVAGILKDALPDSATVARYAGDEFAGALWGVPLDQAFTYMEDVRRQVLEMRIPGHPELSVSCSVGLASYPRDGRTEDQLVREADQALYSAKVGGRNRVALPVADSRMVTKTSHYTTTKLERIALTAKGLNRNEASLLREALDDVLKKYGDEVSL